MSGTSVDGIDSALIHSHEGRVRLLASRQHPIAEEVRAEIAALSHPTTNEIERMGRLDRELGGLFADAALALLEKAGTEASAITAIGSHGQTIRHAPPADADDKRGFTVQIGDPNTIAERCGITTVADFRRRDIAAGGEGAPLAPAFHAAVFAHRGRHRAIVNIGGI
ncbi:MAG: anhydro-N-acetylmuramic acid kinase, partial [Halioglobus sp.]|nr:anhydro-N-acetylmuramic acid kinase [Halioglobus sp.]